VLKTALKPRWIMTLILVMALAAVFVLLSQWQFSSSRQAAPATPPTTETVRPLTDVLAPGSPLTAAAADQMVSADGTFLPGTRLLVPERLQDGREGLWLISAFAVEGAAAPGDPARSPRWSSPSCTAGCPTPPPRSASRNSPALPP
jgi:cytochrome oxidase assembly protein ShyY1